VTHVYALTGSVAAGKSSVGALLRAWGATLIDADALVRELQGKGEPVLEAIVAAFGATVLDANLELDRAAMRRRVFSDPAARHRLEAIVHPAVEARRRTLVDAARARGDSIVIADIPLLFEAADPAAYDGVIVVDAPIAERRRRLMHDRKLSAHDADQLIAAQLPASEKRARATWVIDNDSDRSTLEARTRSVWDALQR
jgi:dephospho-CoA kinase